MQWLGLPALDAAASDQPDKFPHPHRIDAAHIDSWRLYPGGEVDDGRTMLDYYRTTCEFHHTTDELIARMKPWYDNYCFAEECYGKTTMYNSNMVLYFVDNYIRRGGQFNPLIPNDSELLKQKFQFMSKIFCCFVFVKTKFGDGLIE
jgi:hypothetical protein